MSEMDLSERMRRRRRGKISLAFSADSLNCIDSEVEEEDVKTSCVWFSSEDGLRVQPDEREGCAIPVFSSSSLI